MSNESINLIKSLPKHYAKTLSEKCQVSRPTVYRVLEKGDTTHEVYIEAIKLAEAHKAEKEEINARLKKLKVA